MQTDLVDLTVADLMDRWPRTVRVFLDRRMHCVGCPIAPFHTLVDAAREHGLLLAVLIEDVELRRLEISGFQSVPE